MLGLDLDPQALEIASQRLSAFESRVTLLKTSYTTLQAQLARLGWATVDGIVIDLGVSSMQIDTPERGFSFLMDGPLDMRFSPAQTTSAADLVNTLPETELADLIFRYGEEKLSRRIARAIIQARPLRTTKGENTSAAWGVVNFLLRLREKYHPDYLAWVHDAGDSFRTPAQAKLVGDQARLYELIWQRTVASQMTDARGQAVSVKIAGSVYSRRNASRTRGCSLFFA